MNNVLNFKCEEFPNVLALFSANANRFFYIEICFSVNVNRFFDNEIY